MTIILFLRKDTEYWRNIADQLADVSPRNPMSDQPAGVAVNSLSGYRDALAMNVPVYDFRYLVEEKLLGQGTGGSVVL